MTEDSRQFDPEAAGKLLAREHPGHYAEARLGHHNEPFHWEWYDYRD